ncbi:MAG: hypothetical protein CL916_09020 [Deltaproteobacteria bacterium]|nr:hypothetical protein [Deltaproteobacteria bacterium]
MEGITNLLWTLLFVPVFAMGADPVYASVVLGLGSLLLLFYGVLSLCKVLDVPPFWPLLLLACDASILLEAVEGLESIFFSALLCWAIFWGLRAKGKYSWRSMICFSLALGTRPETPLVFFLFQFFLFWRERNLRSFLMQVATFIGVGFVLSVWRFWYYGDFLPNTFYAKVGGLAIWRGVLYLKFYAQYHIFLMVSLIWGWKYEKFRPLLMLYTAYVLYVVIVGGDFKFTSRFLLPLVCVPIVLGGFLLAQSRGWSRIVLLILWIVPQARLYERSLTWAHDRAQNLIARRVAGLWVRANTPSYAKIAIHSVGVIPFYAERYTIDMWGLNDRVIARTPIKDFGSGLAGHERSNPEYVFSQSPDMYLPEDDVFLPKKITHKPPEDFPDFFAEQYTSVSIKIGASYLNIWVRKDLIPDKKKSKEVEP